MSKHPNNLFGNKRVTFYSLCDSILYYINVELITLDRDILSFHIIIYISYIYFSGQEIVNTCLNNVPSNKT